MTNLLKFFFFLKNLREVSGKKRVITSFSVLITRDRDHNGSLLMAVSEMHRDDMYEIIRIKETM